MKSPYGLEILDNCMQCPVREQHIFCNLSPPMVERLNDITSSAIYPRDAMLFIEGQKARGVFVLCRGKTKLSATSRDGRTIIIKISGHGDVLGLGAYEEIRTLGLTNSPGQKFAKLILGWSAERGDSSHSLNLHLILTHEEIAEMIGTTRETVSRLFASFRKKQLIQLKGTSLVILNKLALERMAA